MRVYVLKTDKGDEYHQSQRTVSVRTSRNKILADAKKERRADPTGFGMQMWIEEWNATTGRERKNVFKQWFTPYHGGEWMEELPDKTVIKAA